MTVLSGIKWRASSSSSWSNLLDITFPTNSIYITYTNNSPANFLGGTWARIGDNRMLIGAGSSYTSGSTGGSANAIVVSHSHSASSGSAGAHTHTISAYSAGSHSHRTTSNGAHNHEFAKMDGSAGTNTGWSVAMQNTTKWYKAGGTYVYSNGAHTHTANSAGAHTHSGAAASAGAHSHTISVASNGSSGTNANLPPYLGVYFWRRTA